MGFIELNKENKYNVLSLEFMKEIKRCMMSHEVSEDIQFVVLTTKKNEVFCGGADLKYLFHKRNDKNIEAVDEYLQSLYNFTTFVASYHKPCITVSNGITQGAGAAFLSSINFPCVTHNTTVSYPETNYGLNPHAGNIYFLSRMKGEIGTFLALTGYVLKGSDLVYLGIASKTVEISETFMSNMADLAHENREYGSTLDHTDGWPSQFLVYQLNRNLEKLQKENEIKNRSGISDDKEWDYPENRKIRPEVFADNLYFDHLRSMNKENGHGENFNYKNSGGDVINYTARFAETIFKDVYANTDSNFSLGDLIGFINRCFNANRVSDIIKNLEAEIHPFAHYCIKRINEKSPIALEVTLRLLRKARNLDYYDILNEELNTMKNLILHSKDFETIMKNKSLTPDKREKKLKFHKNFNEIGEKDIEFYFDRKEQNLKNIQLEIKKNSLLPNREYQFRYPDSFRIWLNEYPRASALIRRDFDYEVKTFLMKDLSIDWRNTNLDMNVIREVISKKELVMFQYKKFNYENMNFFTDQQAIENYLNQRNNIIKQISDSPQKLKILVEEKITELFKSNFKLLSREILSKCRDMRDMEKRKTWLRFKRWMFLNRVMEYKFKNNRIQNERLKAIGPKLLFFPDDNSKTFREMQHPEIHKSPFFELTKLFDIKYNTPEYAMKFASTTKKNDMFFNEIVNLKELNKIKEKLKTDPKSFINIWKNALDKETEANFEDFDDKILIEYQRVYRLKNDGRSPLDELTYAGLYYDIKSVWKDFKDYTTNILRNQTLDLIYELIQESENNEKLSKEIEANKEDYETLVSIINENDRTHEYNVFFNAADKNSLILENVKSSLKNSIINDSLFSNFIKKEDEENNVFNKFFQNQVSTFMEKFILNFMFNQLDEKTLNDKDKQYLGSINKFIKDFNFNNFINSDPKSPDSYKFLDWLYLKNASPDFFTKSITESKYLITSVLKEIINKETNYHKNLMFSCVKNFNILNSTYERELNLYEEKLNKYYRAKMLIANLEFSDRLAQKQFTSLSIDEFNVYMKDLAFGFILNKKEFPMTKNINFILNESDERTPLRQIVQNMLSLKECLNDDINLNSTDFNEIRSTYEKAVEYMKNSNIYTDIVNYAKDIEQTENVNIFDYFNSKFSEEKKRNIDKNVENFMKNKFIETIVNNLDPAEENIETISSDDIQNQLNKRNSEYFIYDLAKKFVKDEIIIQRPSSKSSELDSLNRTTLADNDQFESFAKEFVSPKSTSQILETGLYYLDNQQLIEENFKSINADFQEFREKIKIIFSIGVMRKKTPIIKKKILELKMNVSKIKSMIANVPEGSLKNILMTHFQNCEKMLAITENNLKDTNLSIIDKFRNIFYQIENTVGLEYLEKIDFVVRKDIRESPQYKEQEKLYNENQVLYENTIRRYLSTYPEKFIDVKKFTSKDERPIPKDKAIAMGYVMDQIGITEEEVDHKRIEEYKVYLDLNTFIDECERILDLEKIRFNFLDMIFNKDHHLHKLACELKNYDHVINYDKLANIAEVYINNNKIDPEKKLLKHEVVQSFSEYGRFLLKTKTLIMNEYDNLETDLVKKVSDNQKITQSILKNNLNYFKSFGSRIQNEINKSEAHTKSLEEYYDSQIKRKVLYEKIFSNYSESMDFTTKYDINILLNNENCDVELLFNDIKSSYEKSRTIVLKSNLNIYLKNEKNNYYREIVGTNLNNINYKLDSILEQKLQELNNFNEIPKLPSDKELSSFIRNLVIMDLMKEIQERDTGLYTSLFEENNDNFEKNMNIQDKLIDEIIQLEKKAYQGLIETGRMKENDRYLNKEYKASKMNFEEKSNIIKDIFNCYHLLSKSKNTKEIGLEHLNLDKEAKNFKQKMMKSQSRFGKRLQNNNEIPRNFTFRTSSYLLGEQIDVDWNNFSHKMLYEINSLEQLKNFDKEQENPLKAELKNPSLKYLTLLEHIGYKNPTLRDHLLNNGSKLLSDYLRPSDFEKFFDQKIPFDLIKLALDVYDSRLIKGLQVVLLSNKESTHPFREEIDNFINIFSNMIPYNHYVSDKDPCFLLDVESSSRKLFYYNHLVNNLAMTHPSGKDFLKTVNNVLTDYDYELGVLLLDKVCDDFNEDMKNYNPKRTNEEVKTPEQMIVNNNRIEELKRTLDDYKSVLDEFDVEESDENVSDNEDLVDEEYEGKLMKKISDYLKNPKKYKNGINFFTKEESRILRQTYRINPYNLLKNPKEEMEKFNDYHNPTGNEIMDHYYEQADDIENLIPINIADEPHYYDQAHLLRNVVSKTKNYQKILLDTEKYAQPHLEIDSRDVLDLVAAESDLKRLEVFVDSEGEDIEKIQDEIEPREINTEYMLNEDIPDEVLEEESERLIDHGIKPTWDHLEELYKTGSIEIKSQNQQLEDKLKKENEEKIQKLKRLKAIGMVGGEFYVKNLIPAENESSLEDDIKEELNENKKIKKGRNVEKNTDIESYNNIELLFNMDDPDFINTEVKNDEELFDMNQLDESDNSGSESEGEIGSDVEFEEVHDLRKSKSKKNEIDSEEEDGREFLDEDQKDLVGSEKIKKNILEEELEKEYLKEREKEEDIEEIDDEIGQEDLDILENDEETNKYIDKLDPSTHDKEDKDDIKNAKDISDISDTELDRDRLEGEIEHFKNRENLEDYHHQLGMRDTVIKIIDKFAFKNKILKYTPDFEKTPLEKFVENIETMGIQKDQWKEIQDKLYDLVPAPDFSDKYSVLKYIYDYYIGNLRIDIKSSYVDAYPRMRLLEKIRQFNEFDDVLRGYPYDESKSDSKYVQNRNVLNIGKDLSVPSSEEMGNDYKISMLNYSRYMNVIAEISKKGSFDEHPWEVELNDRASLEAAETYHNYHVAYEYQKMNQDHGPEYYKDLSKETKALTMYLTEKMRDLNEKVSSTNENLYNQRYNLNEMTMNSVGYGNIEKRMEDSKASGYEDVIEEM